MHMTMAVRISSYDQINQLNELHGIPLADVENSFHDQRNNVCFLASDETVIGVIQKDWATVSQLGTTHIGLADKIQSIFDCANVKSLNALETVNLLYNPSTNEMRQIDLWWMYSGTLLFLISTVISVVLTVVTFYAAPLVLLAISTIPCIVSIWRNNQFLIVTKENEGTDDFFIRVANYKNNEFFRVSNRGIESIRLYGFYLGGGESNPYRIDPVRLVAVLTGESLSSVRERAQVAR